MMKCYSNTCRAQAPDTPIEAILQGWLIEEGVDEDDVILICPRCQREDVRQWA